MRIVAMRKTTSRLAGGVLCADKEVALGGVCRNQREKNCIRRAR